MSDKILVSNDVSAALRYIRAVAPATDSIGLPAILQPLKPRGKGWTNWDEYIVPELRLRAYAIQRWYNRGQEVQAMSAVELVAQDEGGERLEYHISLSRVPYQRTPRRLSMSRARWALKEFGAEGFLEDNHVPSGIVRNFWRPLNELEVGKVCKCVESEPAIREMKGDFTWRAVPG